MASVDFTILQVRWLNEGLGGFLVVETGALLFGLVLLVTTSKGPFTVESYAGAFKKAKKWFILDPTNIYCMPSTEQESKSLSSWSLDILMTWDLRLHKIHVASRRLCCGGKHSRKSNGNGCLTATRTMRGLEEGVRMKDGRPGRSRSHVARAVIGCILCKSQSSHTRTKVSLWLTIFSYSSLSLHKSSSDLLNTFTQVQFLIR